MTARGRDAGVTSIVGDILILGITVSAAAGLFLAIMAMPPPVETTHVVLQAFVQPTELDTLTIEHRGGAEIGLQGLRVLLLLDGVPSSHVVGERLAAGDPAWAVTSPGGAAKSASDLFATGDQVRYTSSDIPGSATTVTVVDVRAGVALFLPLDVQNSDAVRPRPISARTVSTTGVEVTMDEALSVVAASDFTVSGVTVQSASLVGDGNIARLVTTAMSPSATPTVASIASPTGTFDLALNALQGGVSLVAADGTPPTITVGPSASVGTSTATITWTTDEDSDSTVSFGPTPALGRTNNDASVVTSHTVGLAGLSPGTLFSYTVTSTDAAGNARTSALLTFTTNPASQGSNPSFSGPVVNVIYSSVQVKEMNTQVGLNIINPTGTALQVDSVRFSAAPALTGGNAAENAFFRGTLSTGTGSDPEFNCVWSGGGTDAVTCDPAGTFAVPALGMKQVVLNFQTSKASNDGYTILAGEAVVTSPTSDTYWSEVNVRHQQGGVMVTLFGLSASGGNRVAGHPTFTGGSPADFHYKWKMLAQDAKTSTRFIIPAGWTDLSVPSQPSLSDMSVTVRQPTPTSQGYVDVAKDRLNNEDQELYFRVTPPAGVDVLVMQVDFEGSKEGSSKLSFQNLLWFAVEIT